MKIKVITIFLFVSLLIGCNSNIVNKQTLSVTIEPQRYFLEQLVGDKYAVNCIIPAGANPETFDPVPSQLIGVSKSKAFFVLGSLSVEETLIAKIKENNPDVAFINCSDNITLIENHIHDDHTLSHHHGIDPHIWSSPSTAKVIVKNMYDALINLDETNQDYYAANYNSLITSINKTDSIIRINLAQTEEKQFIIYHPALSYYAQDYGLVQHVIENDGKSPTPNQLAHLIDVAKENKIKLVFIQQEYDEKNAETIAKAIDGHTVSLNLLNYDWHEEMIHISKSFVHE